MSLHWQNSEATQNKVVSFFSEEHDYSLALLVPSNYVLSIIIDFLL